MRIYAGCYMIDNSEIPNSVTPSEVEGRNYKGNDYLYAPFAGPARKSNR